MAESRPVKEQRSKRRGRVRYLVLSAVLVLFMLAAKYYLVGAQPEQTPAAGEIGEIAVPRGFARVPVAEGSFGAWLRNVPLRPPSSRIRLYNGKRKLWQHGLHQVVDLPIGDKDLQQCADVAIRLRSDYLRSRDRIDEIAFNFTNGDRARYSEWIAGYRPNVRGNDVTWRQSGAVDSSEAAYRDYLDTVFMYAGSYSLSREMVKVGDGQQAAAGDCFVQGGFPGHVIMVVDVAVDSLSGDKLILLAQGFTPAQDIHIIRNASDSELNPWYRVGEGRRLETPEWTFDWSELYTFDDNEVTD